MKAYVFEENRIKIGKFRNSREFLRILAFQDVRSEPRFGVLRMILKKKIYYLFAK